MKIARRNVMVLAGLLLAFLSATPPLTARTADSAVLQTRRLCRQIDAVINHSRHEDKKLSDCLDHLLQTTHDPAALHGIAVWSLRRMIACEKMGYKPICGRYELARDSSIFYLSNIKKDKAAQLLVSLFSEPEMNDGHAAELMSVAVTHLGRKTLPYLLAIRPRSNWTKTVIAAVRSGKQLSF